MLERGRDDAKQLGRGDELLPVCLVHEHGGAACEEAPARHARILRVPAQQCREGSDAAHTQLLSSLRVAKHDGERLEDGRERGGRVHDRERRRDKRVHRPLEHDQRHRLLLLLERRADLRRRLGECDAALGVHADEVELHLAAAEGELELLLLALVRRRLERRLERAQPDDHCRVVRRITARNALDNVGEVDTLRLELLDGVGKRLLGFHRQIIDVLLDHLVEGLLRDARVQRGLLLLVRVVSASSRAKAHGES